MDEANATNIGIIILAAGSSSRLGEPKQLVEFRGKTLLENVIQTAYKTNYMSVSVVLGANAEVIGKKLKGYPIQVFMNEIWQNGMSSSLQIGLKHYLDKDAVIVLLCDQPLIKAEHIHLLIKKFNKTKKPIIASKYNETIGVPALFAKEVFDKLMLIEGDKGARKIINDFPELVETISIPEAAFDIDTPKDIEKLSKF